ncbi:MAG: 16S rRNA (guanine(527)-N(7))-methyltransferase RsmG [Bacteroidales bacterium]|jgi:16S rRNA (guanine527-N7)-methyltransferase|nr:16S rRNA (guanine(527)-N(7))-methyltransferase RsmG [Bacteroidales bacterium]
MLHDIEKCFPNLTKEQLENLLRLKDIYIHWNSMINVISRKDMDNFYTHHVLHSLTIAMFIDFVPGTSVLDVGTGGGFPGIPLAILFPESEFTLLDSTEKKIKVVAAVKNELNLTNIIPLAKRIENEKSRYHFVISRAVMKFPELVKTTRKNIHTGSVNKIPNGIICLKGGDLTEELAPFAGKVKTYGINTFCDNSFFETKKIVYLPV